jgi:hypothetical protein
MALRATVYGGVRASLAGSADLGTPKFELDTGAVAKEFANGTSSGQVSKLFSDSRTLAASASESLDLSGALVDALGQATVFTVVKAIMVKAAAGNANNVVVGGAASNAFVGPFADATDKIAVPPGGMLLLVHPGAGWTVTSGTGDLLQIANSGAGTSVDYDVVIAG